MFRSNLLNRAPALSKATRLQLGNIKTDYGSVSTAAGSSEKWGFIYRVNRYPMLGYIFGISFIVITQTVIACYYQYRDMLIMADHICYEDVRDRVLTPIPGIARLKTIQMMGAENIYAYRDPTPLDWLPFELKLGAVKQASY